MSSTPLQVASRIAFPSVANRTGCVCGRNPGATRSVTPVTCVDDALKVLSRSRVESAASRGICARAALLILLISCTRRDADRQSATPGQQPGSVAPATPPSPPTPVPNDPREQASSLAIGYFPASVLRRTGDALAQSQLSGRSIHENASYRVVASRRVTTGEPEVHDDWTDVTFVEAGHAVLLGGGQVNGGRLVSSGEHRGGRITGGQDEPVAAGDVLVVPAGVAHQFRLTPGDSIRYVTIKVPRR